MAGYRVCPLPVPTVDDRPLQGHGERQHPLRLAFVRHRKGRSIWPEPLIRWRNHHHAGYAPCLPHGVELTERLPSTAQQQRKQTKS
ncbi:hypothetical protein [Pontibacter rugosus]